MMLCELLKLITVVFHRVCLRTGVIAAKMSFNLKPDALRVLR